jgi:outer membrane lipoprotein-sorting protein
MIPIKSIFTAILLLITFISWSQESGEILTRMESNMRGHAAFAEITMDITRSGRTREIEMKYWSLGDDYRLIYIIAPEQEAGTAYLKRKNEIWNYQPRIRRTVRIPLSMVSQSWMGSDFTNDDLIGGTSAIYDYHHEFSGKTRIDGHDCYIIELTPYLESPVVYEKVIYFISRDYYLPLKIENYNEFDELVSTVLFREIREFDGRYFPSVREMIPAGGENRKTVITIHTKTFGIDISEEFFTVENLTEVR